MKLVVNLNSEFEFWQIQSRHIQQIEAEFSELEIEQVDHKLSNLKHILKEADFYYGWQFPEKWFELSPHLKCIMTPAAGADCVSRTKLQEHGVTLLHSKGYHGIPMAQHAIGLILGFSRGLFISQQLQSQELWWKSTINDTFFDLEGETLTIVGCGSIGEKVAELALPLGLKVVGVRRTIPENANPDIQWIPSTQIDKILPESKIVINLLPKNEGTDKFFNLERFAVMQRGSVFINLGRGSTVCEAALIRAIEEGIVSWCGLDVFDPKPPSMDHPLRYFPNVVMTPKSSVYCRRYMDYAVNYFVQVMSQYLRGEALDNITYLPASINESETLNHSDSK